MSGSCPLRSQITMHIFFSYTTHIDYIHFEVLKLTHLPIWVSLWFSLHLGFAFIYSSLIHPPNKHSLTPSRTHTHARTHTCTQTHTHLIKYWVPLAGSPPSYIKPPFPGVHFFIRAGIEKEKGTSFAFLSLMSSYFWSGALWTGN